MKQQVISGADAIRLMRLHSRRENGEFSIMHLSADMTKRQAGGFKKVERCRLRPSLPERTFQIDSDHYLPYEDLDTGDFKMCFKVLLRYVAFPPKFIWLKINWFNNEKK